MQKNLVVLGLTVVAVFICWSHQWKTNIRFARAPSSLTEELFTERKRENNKSYTEVEHERRYIIFRENLQKIKEINSVKRNFTVDLNKFAELTTDEFTSLYLGINRQPDQYFPPPPKIKPVFGNDTVDWRAENAVTPVKDQGKCGASWAFAVIGALEGFAAIQRGELLVFSEQQLIDCSGDYGNRGCSGGSLENALKYTSEHGIMLDRDYQYTGTEGICKSDISKVNSKNQQYLTANTDSVLRMAVLKGPVAVSVEGDQDVFRFYTSGILDAVECGTYVNHGVLVVGYDVVDEMGYWIVKNSWGSDWGDQGYLKIARQFGAGI